MSFFSNYYETEHNRYDGESQKDEIKKRPKTIREREWENTNLITHFWLVATSIIASLSASLVNMSASILSPNPFSTIASTFLGWSAMKGIPTIGTPLTIVSSDDCRPPWVTKTLTFGWPINDKKL